MNDDKKKTEELKDKQLQKSHELSDEELDQASGGTGGEGGLVVVFIPLEF